MSSLYESIGKVLIVPTTGFWVHLISLHTGENNFKWVRKDTSDQTASKSSISIEVASGLSSRIRVNPIVEVEERPDSSSGITDSSEEEGIEARVELSEATSGSHCLVENLDAVKTSPKTNASEALTFLKELSASLN